MGIAFQKLNGAGTVPGAQLEQLEEINQMIGESGFKPEIWKLARMFAPDVTLTPVQFVVDLTRDAETEVADWFDGNLYYGKWSYGFNYNYPLSNYNDTLKYVFLEFFKDGAIQQRYRDGSIGHENFPVQSQRGEFIGFADFIRVRRSGRLTDGWNCVVEFQGFVLGEGGVDPEPVEPPNYTNVVGDVWFKNNFQQEYGEVKKDSGSFAYQSLSQPIRYFATAVIRVKIHQWIDEFFGLVPNIPDFDYNEDNGMWLSHFIDETSPAFNGDLTLSFNILGSSYDVNLGTGTGAVGFAVNFFSPFRQSGYTTGTSFNFASRLCVDSDGFTYIFVRAGSDYGAAITLGHTTDGSDNIATYVRTETDGTYFYHILKVQPLDFVEGSYYVKML